MSNKKLWILGLVVLIAIGGTVAVTRLKQSGGHVPELDASRTPVQVAQWGQERYLIYLPLYVAMEERYFDDEGLAVNIKFSGNDDQTFAAVVSGDAQFGVGDPAFAAISQERGFPARVIATVVGGVAIWGVTNVPSISTLKSPADLSGLRIGTFPAPSTNYTLMQQLIRKMPSGLKPPKVVEAPIGAQIALLESRAADIAMVLEPAASVAESEGYRVVYSSPRFHGSFAFTGVTTTADFIRDHPDTAARFVRGLERAVVACHKDHEVAVRVARSLFPNLSETIVRKAVSRMLDEKTFPTTVVISEEAWQNALGVRLAVGDLKSPQQTSTTVDNSFALRAQQTITAGRL